MFALLVVEGLIEASGLSVGTKLPTPYLREREPDLVIAFKYHPKSGRPIPYIPASSWVGVLRHLLEKYYNLPANIPRLVRARKIIAPIHECENENDKLKCPVCKLFARRDVVAWFDDAEPEGAEYTITIRGAQVEIRNEQGALVAIVFLKDEVTIPREVDRIQIPVGAIPGISGDDTIGAEKIMREGWRLEPIPRRVQQVSGIFAINAKFDISRLSVSDIRPFFIGLALLEDYYVGRRGTRGYGRIKIGNIRIKIRGPAYYEGTDGEIEIKLPEDARTPRGILKQWQLVEQKILEAIKKLTK